MVSQPIITVLPVKGRGAITLFTTWSRQFAAPPIFRSPRNCQPFRPLPASTRTSHRDFSSSTNLYKKGGKQENKRNVENAAAQMADVDPFDFSELQAGIQRALERLKDDLSKLRPGGRFNPDILEALRVHLVKGDKETVRLGDLAQAIPKGGRAVVVLVGEADVRPDLGSLYNKSICMYIANHLSIVYSMSNP